MYNLYAYHKIFLFHKRQQAFLAIQTHADLLVIIIQCIYLKEIPEMPWTVQLIKLLSDNYFNFSSQSNKNFLLIKDKREHMNAYHNYWCTVPLKS